jgi:copper chaperone CopZ
MKKICIALAMGIAALSATAATSTKFTVNGMVCSFCAQGIETVAVEAKDGQVLDAKAISAEIVDAGYDVVKIETVLQSVAEIKAELKSRK